jgi:hypothetical protein
MYAGRSSNVRKRLWRRGVHTAPAMQEKARMLLALGSGTRTRRSDEGPTSPASSSSDRFRRCATCCCPSTNDDDAAWTGDRTSCCSHRRLCSGSSRSTMLVDDLVDERDEAFHPRDPVRVVGAKWLSWSEDLGLVCPFMPLLCMCVCGLTS